MPARLLAQHGDLVPGKLGVVTDALVEVLLRMCVGEGAHLACVAEPLGRDRTEVLAVEDMEAAHLRL